MPKANIVTMHLDNAIAEVVANKDLYVNNPGKDFCRNRKLPLSDLIYSILEMKGGSLTSEMIRMCDKLNTSLSKSAFVQQRDKLKSDAFLAIFRSFNDKCKYHNLYWGYRLLAVDGCDVNIHFNEGDTCISNGVGQFYSQIHLNALYDLMNHIYIDVVAQGRAVIDERSALIEMYQRTHLDGKAIVIADRGYESLNLITYFSESQNYDLLLRVKTGKTGIKEISRLPMEELDSDIDVSITTTQTNEDKALGRHWVQTAKNTNKTYNKKYTKWDFGSPYSLKFRVVRFKLDTGEYETLVTTLHATNFLSMP